jgi:hypothetical protein
VKIQSLPVALALLVALPCLAAPPAHAQDGPGFLVGGGLALSVPQGEFDDHVGPGGGLNLHGGWGAPGGVLALRGDLDLSIYGSETFRVPLSETVQRVSVDVTTDNWFGNFRVGPQLMVPRGPVRPYVHAQIGFSYFATTSGVSGSDDFDNFASTTNYDDVSFSYAVGGGVYVPLHQGRRGTLALDLNATYLHNGRVSYLTEGDIHDSGGDLVITPHRSQANVVLVRLGVTFVR